MKVKVSLILLGIFFLGCILANAGEYHVSVNGSNDAAGSAEHPFKTISSAAAIAQPGDIITIHEGIYRERVNPPRGGLSNERRIVYRAAKGEKVVIKGSEVIKGWTKLKNDTRVTPYQFEHSTNIAGFRVIKSGDDRYYNNIFMSYNQEALWPERNGPKQEGNFFGLGAYKSIDFPMVADGNVYVDQAKAFEAEEKPVVNADFRTYARTITNEDGVYLKIKIDKDWLKKQRKLVTTELLGKTENQDLPFVQPDGTPYILDTDYSGKSRNLKNPSPGPFAKVRDGLMTIRVWNR
jgi:hypothetical protein